MGLDPNIWICHNWLVGATYPSEKSWISSVGMMTFPIYGKMFQPPTSNVFQSRMPKRCLSKLTCFTGCWCNNILKNMSSSMGRVIPWKNKKMFQTTNQ